MKIIACNSNRPLSEAIAAYLNIPLTKASVRRFSDMECFVEIQENVRGEDVFIIQSTSYPANDHLMELLVALDAVRRGSASRITAVIPYFGYARQDRKSGPRTPISAKLVANLITVAGADRVLTMDLHAGLDPGFFRYPARQFVLGAGANSAYRGPFRQGRLHHGLTGRRRRRPRLGIREAARNRPRDHRQTYERVGVSEVMHIIGDVKDRPASLSTILSILEAIFLQCRRRADSSGREGRPRVYNPWRTLRAEQSAGSRRRSRAW